MILFLIDAMGDLTNNVDALKRLRRKLEKIVDTKKSCEGEVSSGAVLWAGTYLFNVILVTL